MAGNQHPLADPWTRIAARLIDGVIIFGIAQTVLSGWFGGDDDLDDRLTEFHPGLFVGLLLFGLVYEAGFVAWKGGTPGKLVLGLRVVEGATLATPPSPGTAVMRWAPTLAGNVPYVGGLLAVAIVVLSLVWIFSDPGRRSVYDRVASTYVVRVR